MVIIKAVIIFENETLINKIKSYLGFFRYEIKKSEYGEGMIVRTGISANRKKLIAFLKKNHISDIAVYPETKENISIIEGNGIKILTAGQAMLNIIDKVVKKTAGSVGIKKGKAAIGISFAEDRERILESMEKLEDYISRIYIYGKREGKISLAAEEFFERTGISVIFSKDLRAGQCDILIYDGKQKIKKFSGKIILIGKCEEPVTGMVCGVRIKIPAEVETEELPDCVTAGIFGIPPKITKLIIAS